MPQSNRFTGTLMHLASKGAGRPWQAGLFVLCALIVHGYFTLTYGALLTLDSHRYIEWADLLLAAGYRVSGVIQASSFYVSPMLYIVFVYLVAILKSLFGSGWTAALIVVNTLLLAFGGHFVLRSIQRATDALLPLSVAGFYLIFCYELFVWNRYVLTDIVFVFLCCALLYTAVMLTHREDAVPWRPGLLLLVAGLALFTRPTSMPLLALAVIVLVLHRKYGLFTSRDRTRFLYRYLGVSLVLICLGVAAASILFAKPDLLPDFLRDHPVIAYYRKYVQQGAIVHDRPYTYKTMDGGIIDVFHLILLRFLYFFALTLQGYSPAHTVYNLIYFLPVYGLAATASFELFRKDTVLSGRESWLVFLGLNTVILFALFTSVTLLDYDHRYRLPAILPLIGLAAIGAEVFRKRIARNQR